MHPAATDAIECVSFLSVPRGQEEAVRRCVFLAVEGLQQGH